MEKISPLAKSIVLGRVTIESVNQIGEKIRRDKKTEGFALGKRGSVFTLHAITDSDRELSDFREMTSIPVRIEVEGRYLTCDPITKKAVASEIGSPTSGNSLYIVKRKFSGTSTSICYVDNGVESWLRHSNSRLRFDSSGTGFEFNQDASFMIRPCRDETVESPPTAKKPRRSLAHPPASESDTFPPDKKPDEPVAPISLSRMPETSKDNICESSDNLAPQQVSELWGRINRVMTRVRDIQNRTRSKNRSI